MRVAAQIGYGVPTCMMMITLGIGCAWLYVWRYRTPIRQRDPLIVIAVTICMMIFMFGEFLAVMIEEYPCIVQLLQTDYSILTACVLYLYRSINLVFNYSIARYQLLLSTALNTAPHSTHHVPSSTTVLPLQSTPSPLLTFGFRRASGTAAASPTAAAVAAATLAARNSIKMTPPGNGAPAHTTTLSITTLPRTAAILRPNCWVRARACRRSWPLRIALFLIWATLIVMLLVTRLSLPSNAKAFCDEGPSVSQWSTGYVIAFAILFFLVALNLHQADNDSFYLKTELKYIGVFLLFTIPITILETTFLSPEWYRNNYPLGSITGVLNAWIVMSFSIYWPIWHAYRLQQRLDEPDNKTRARRRATNGGKRRTARKRSDGKDGDSPAGNYSVSSFPVLTLASLLSNDSGRASFRRYLTKEFAVENLSFIEACDEFTTLALTLGISTSATATSATTGNHSIASLELSRRAVIIYYRFINNGASFQVNLSSVIVSRIRKQLDAHLKFHAARDPKRRSRETSRVSRHAPVVHNNANTTGTGTSNGIAAFVRAATLPNQRSTATATAAASTAINVALTGSTFASSHISPRRIAPAPTNSINISTPASSTTPSTIIGVSTSTQPPQPSPAVTINVPMLSSPTANAPPMSPSILPTVAITPALEVAPPTPAPLSTPLPSQPTPPVLVGGITINVTLRAPTQSFGPPSPSVGPVSSLGGHISTNAGVATNNLPEFHTLPALNTGMFGEARQAIFDLLQFDVFPRYLKSSVYDDYCNMNREQREATMAAAVNAANNTNNNSPRLGQMATARGSPHPISSTPPLPMVTIHIASPSGYGGIEAQRRLSPVAGTGRGTPPTGSGNTIMPPSSLPTGGLPPPPSSSPNIGHRSIDDNEEVDEDMREEHEVVSFG